jgi:DNA-binding response OmpR family regulator
MSADRILIVEDDDDIGSELLTVLQAEGYDAMWARTGRAARDLAANGADLVLLDLGLPDVDGVAVCRDLRRELPDALIVALTARTAELDVIVTLDAGADDYLTKPFRLSELLARLRAHLRRRPPGDSHEVRVGSLAMNLLARTVTISERAVHLRPKEFDLLAALASREGSVVTRDDLMTQVWDERWVGQTKTLDVHIAGLRRKVRSARGDGQIVTVRGHGYTYEKDR